MDEVILGPVQVDHSEGQRRQPGILRLQERRMANCNRGQSHEEKMAEHPTKL